jgi:hypothetical protein
MTTPLAYVVVAVADEQAASPQVRGNTAAALASVRFLRGMGSLSIVSDADPGPVGRIRWPSSARVEVHAFRLTATRR